ncbi:24 kDa ookinete surface protein-like [Stegodyphus dumicola]|uniref:24 kDa ookinete surface protein-like n=1 Tax=Stegodyphus dumicola TaxID=202533 RepID=UPI0015AE5E05|nr:24 kDa ookinete surface protein-like [Stegodyphus dumicola]
MNSTELNQQANCKCINGKCVLNENGENVCKCPPEFSHYTPTECKECDCGEESSCTFSKGTYKRKTCVCKEGYWLRGSKCKICKCENGKCVEIEPGKTICQCPPEFSLYLHNECRACNCGKGKNCTFGSWNSAFMEKEKVCICQEGSVDAKVLA